MEFSGGDGRRVGVGSGQPGIDGWQKEGSQFRLCVSPSGGRDRAATITVAATGVAKNGLFGARGQRILAVMNSLAEAASTRRGCSRERKWDETSHECEQQQQSGGQAMHVLLRNKNPGGGVSIERNPQWAQARRARAVRRKSCPDTNLKSFNRSSERIFLTQIRASGFAVDLGPPPADAYEQETPVGKKLRRLAFEGMADELENPSQDK